MPKRETEPHTTEKPYWFSRLLPLLILCGLGVVIVVMGQFVQAKKMRLAEEKRNAQLQERPPVNSIVLELATGPIRDRLNLPGVVEPWEDLTLMAKVGGTITEVLVDEGAAVKQGQVIARIEEDDYRIGLAAAQAAHSLAQADYQRNQERYQKKLLPLAQLQARETNLQTSKAELDNATLQLERCTITAPMAGVVQRLDAKKGLLLGRGDSVARLLQIDQVLAVVGIPESDVAAIRGLTEVEVAIQALAQSRLARIHYLSPAPQQTARLYRLELALDNPEQAILPGMFVRADIVKAAKAQALTLPLYAIISRNNEQYVFVEKNGRAEKRPVQTGITEGWLVEITSGLQAGERVVLEGHRELEDGRAMKVIEIVKPGVGGQVSGTSLPGFLTPGS